MGIEFIGRTIKTSALVLLFAFPFLLYYIGLFGSLSFLSGAIWGILNLMLLTSLVQSVIRPGGAQGARAVVVGLVKFPLLYGCGFFLLTIEQFDVRWLLAGGTLSLAVIILKAGGRLLIKADEQSREDGSSKSAQMSSSQVSV